MTKNILLVCEHHQIDPPLRRSLAHLAKCCEITLVHDGHEFFEQLSAKAFDLIIIDFEISEFDGLELVESVQYIDPGVPVILILKETHKAIWNAARHLNAHPIIRPFKPLRFLRLVDKLLHQYLNYYRKLTATLKTTLESLIYRTAAPCAFLLDSSGEIIIASGELTDISLSELGELVTESLLGEHRQARSMDCYLQGNYGVYLRLVADGIYLALVTSAEHNVRESAVTWQTIHAVASQISTVLNNEIPADLPYRTDQYGTPALKFMPLEGQTNSDKRHTSTFDQYRQPENSVNWAIISNTPNPSDRIENSGQFHR